MALLQYLANFLIFLKIEIKLLIVEIYFLV